SLKSKLARRPMETALGSSVIGSSAFTLVPPALVAADSSLDINVDKSRGIAGLFASEPCSVRFFGVVGSSETRGRVVTPLTVEFVAAAGADALATSRGAGVAKAAAGAAGSTCW